MSVRSLVRSGLVNFTQTRSMLVGNEAYVEPGDYELISTTILGSPAASVTISSIPQDYKHLQLRITARGTRDFSGNSIDVYSLALNGINDTTGHALFGNGSTVSSFVTSFIGFPPSVSSPATNSLIFGGAVIDILDYTNTGKNRVVRSLSGHQITNNGNGDIGNIAIFSNLYLSTEATNTIAISPVGGSTWVAGSRFSVYGIRG